MHQSLGYAIPSKDGVLIWTVSLTDKEAEAKYLKFLREDDKSIKTCPDRAVPVLVTSYDPSNTLKERDMDIFLAGYRRGLDAQNK